MGIHSFSLVLEGPEPSDADLDRIYEAGCDDAMFETRSGVQVANFDRDDASFASAVISAMRDIEGASNLRAVRVEPDDFVTASAIADRTGRSKESVRLLIKGDRGPGGFPPPVSWLDGTSKVWNWAEVSDWLASWSGQLTHDAATFRYVAALNAALETRRQLEALRVTPSGLDPDTITPADVEALEEIVSDTAAVLQQGLADR